MTVGKNNANNKAKVDNVAANIGGKKVLGLLGSEPANIPPIAGPKINPMPKAAPKNPIALALFSFVVISDIYAWAVEIFPAIKPAKALAINKLYNVLE